MLVAPVVGAKTRQHILDQTLSAQDFISNQNRSGIFPTATILQNAGKLLIRSREGGGKSSCSGIAINQDYFLTAAHCVCNLVGLQARNASECNLNLNKLELTLFFPNHGLVKVDGVPFVNPRYRSPTYIAEGAMGEIADIAVIRLKTPINVRAIQLGGGVGKHQVLGAGLMYFSVPKILTAFGLPEGVALHDGVFHMWRLREIFSDGDACGEMHSLDTFCSFFSTIRVLRGPLQSATVCVGDSGSPVFRLSETGAVALDGITSYFSPKNNYDQCLADVEKRNHYVDVLRYKHWISGFKSQRDTDYGENVCASALFRHGESVDLIGYSGRLTATSFDSRLAKRPKITIISNNKECMSDDEFGVSSCNIHKSALTSVSIEGGFVQITLCGG